MNKDQFTSVMFLALAAMVLYLFYGIVSPFFFPLGYALSLVIVFYPLYERLSAKVTNPNLASAIMCVVVVIVIVGPMIYLLTTLAGEARSAFNYLNAMNESGELDKLAEMKVPGVDILQQQLGKFTDPENLTLKALTLNGLNAVSGIIKAQLATIIANTGKTVFYFGIMVFSMFFLFRDGREFANHCSVLIPLPQEQVDKTLSYLRSVVEATIMGGVVVALLQGIAGGILFAAVGIPSSIFWGAMMAFLSFLPLVGAFIVFIPAAIFLILSGSVLKGVIVLVVGILIIAQIDNFVRPMLIAGKTSMHTLLLFISILGGIVLFGLLGIVLGPVIAALMLTLMQILDTRLHGDIAPATATEAASEGESV